MSDDAQTFRTVLGVQATGRRELALPFDPAEVWGRRDRYHVTGTIDGNPVRGPLSSVAGGWVLPVGALWCQDPRFTEPTEVAAELRLEGPQRDHLADDVAEALAAHPDAAAFWDSLATFYRKGYLRWIDATKRRPELRAARIAEMIALLRGGHKQRPRS
jgi:Bacteriocin-protection, YdeI or OmpD-Associated/Domain of unknown function (DUF1905)